MQELTSSINDEDVVNFFTETLAPFANEHQRTFMTQSGKSTAVSLEAEKELVAAFESDLVEAVREESKEVNFIHI